MKDCVIRARTEPSVKDKAEKIFQRLGMSSSQAIRIFLHMVIEYKGLPFDMRIPNNETIKAMKDAAESNNLTECKDCEDLFKKLGI